MRFVLPIAAVAALVLAGCSIEDDGSPRTQTREVRAFTHIANESSVDVHVRVGERRRVVARGGEKVIDDIRTEVHDGRLEISFDHHGWGGNSASVDVTVPKLTAISLDGSGDIDVDGISADAFELASDGSADITLAGTADRLSVELHGSGDADLAALTARDADVRVDGSGNAEVRADERLDVDVEGSGDVKYHGDPEVDQHVDGSGDLSRAS
jgi:hypothetical protein